MSLLEHRRNEEILEEAKKDKIVKVVRNLESFEHVKRRDKAENVRAVAER